MIEVTTLLIIQATGEKPGYVRAKWIYREDDPLAVALEMPPNEGETEPNEWCFGRELLSEALSNLGKTVGDHDVKLTLQGTRLIIRLAEQSSDSGTRLFAMTADAKRFLHNTYRQVPYGKEQEIIDMQLDQFLADVAS